MNGQGVTYGILLSHTQKIQASVTTRMDVEGIMLQQKKTNTVLSYLCEVSNKTELIETEKRLVVAPG